jgi:branched-subunit amino acid aminotransferase/4-amino-4-deoxychorismate lyase
LLSIAVDLGITVEEKDITLQDVRDAKEVFITSSTKRLIPVVQIDEQIFAPFSAGSVTARLYDAFKEKEKNFTQRR